MQLKLISVNCSLPRKVSWHGKPVLTGIYKYAVPGRIALRKSNLDGDRQADLTVHGGEEKAVYCYPSEHYDYWRSQLPDQELSPGAFGENFTTDGLLEGSVCIGDRLSVGTAEAAVTQPRLPCYKLGVRFGSDEMVRRFLVSHRTGFYLAITREGDVAAGDEIRCVARDPNRVPVSEITRLYLMKTYGPDEIASLQRLLKVPGLPKGWSDYFRERLERIEA